MATPMTLQADFPTTEGLCPDAYSLAVISPAYASPTGKLNSVLQYFYHYFNLNARNMREYAETIESIAVAETLHLKLLGETITALGSQPLFCHNPPTAFNFYSTKYVTYSRNIVNMIEDDILGERRAVALSERMLKKLKNEQVRGIISRILEDDKLHLEKLQFILDKIKR